MPFFIRLAKMKTLCLSQFPAKFRSPQLQCLVSPGTEGLWLSHPPLQGSTTPPTLSHHTEAPTPSSLHWDQDFTSIWGTPMENSHAALTLRYMLSVRLSIQLGGQLIHLCPHCSGTNAWTQKCQESQGSVLQINKRAQGDRGTRQNVVQHTGL